MNLLGGLEYNGDMYFVICIDQKYNQKWYVLNRIHADDRLKMLQGKEAEYRPLTIDDIKRLEIIDKGYVVEALERSKQKHEFKQFGNLRIIPKIIEEIGNAESHSFKENNIIEENTEIEKTIVKAGDGTREKEIIHRTKKAYDNKLRLEMATKDGLYKSINIRFTGIGFSLQMRSDLKFTKNIVLDMKEVDDISNQRHIGGLTIKHITMDTLRGLIDLSWYEDPITLEKKKDYRAITTIPEFEEFVIGGILKAVRLARTLKEQVLLALDSETTGFNMYNLTKENPHRDKVVAIPLSWEDNQGVVVFVDMEHFNNIPADYFFNRIRELVEGNSDLILETGKQSKPFSLDKRKYKIGDDIIDSTATIGSGFDIVDSEQVSRTEFNLIGHNVMFDGRALLTEGVEPWWDNDTLQMAFDLNPKVAKVPVQVLDVETETLPNGSSVSRQIIKTIQGGVGLKNITRRAFGHETPELSDILGKGNEDKYRYLKDIEVATLYGCADADYTRLAFKFLRKLMSDKMYRLYRKQDVPLLNILYKSEYEGLFMDEKQVLILADNADQDRDTIKEFLWNYVGRKISYRLQYEKLYTKYKTDQISIEKLTNEYKKGEHSEAEYGLEISKFYTKEKFELEASNIKVDTKAVYEFDMKAADYRKVMYDILKYPIFGYTKGDKPLPATDKFIMKKLLRAKVEHNELSQDILSVDGKTVLIDAKEFNKYRYPVAYVLSVYGSLNKEYTSYFKPIKETNMEGKLFKNYSMSRIETRRIMNPSQTMKSSLKNLTLPYNWGKDWSMFDFDMAQVEYRIMVSAAGQIEMVARLRDPEKDFHTESASALSGIPAHKIEKKFRKKMKAVHFGIPYGLGDSSMCESMNGTITPALLIETRSLKSAFEEKNDLVIAELERARDLALKPCDEFSDEFKRFAGFVHYTQDEETGEITEHLHQVGVVKNLLGFYRIFDLENLDKKTIASIRRMAGNYPIQAFAAELFRMILIRFFKRCYREGVIDKIKWHMLIHDELLGSFHKSLHPIFLFKMILEECMITFPGHTKYFVGINIGSNWAECKDDSSEAPVLFVDRMVKRWDAGEFKDETWIENAKEYIDAHKYTFLKERIHEVLLELQPDLDTQPIDLATISDNFANYTVRAYVSDFFVPTNYYKTDKRLKLRKDYLSKTDEEKFEITMNQWALEVFGEGKSIRAFDGHIFYAGACADTFVGDTADEVVELEVFDYEDNGYWSFDEDSFTGDSFDGFDEDYLTTEDYVDEYRLGLDFDKLDEVGSVEDFVKQESKAIYVNMRGNSLVIRCSIRSVRFEIENFLAQYKDPNGVQILFTGSTTIKGIKVSKTLDKEVVNNFVVDAMNRNLNAKVTDYRNLEIKDSVVLINLKQLTEVPKDILAYLRTNKTSAGYEVKFALSKQIATFKHIPYSLSIKELDDLVSQTISLAISKTTRLKHIKDRGTYINITCKNESIKESVKTHLKPFVNSTGKLVRFTDGGNGETWLKVKKDIDLGELDDLIQAQVK